MKIRMKASMAGSGFVLSPGDVTDRFSEAEAKRLIAAGYAEAEAGGKPAMQAKDKPAQRERAVKGGAAETR